ncbi:MAG: hypothetical protein CBC09_05670 [Cellvibrionales bacterium TMED49]|nr:hypothetical protein [Porticoccaceae bacterium]OUU38263.1 MAG: hypothetical protein CBC09_05670 [Cellvibrionales bacterium TMED49]
MTDQREKTCKKHRFSDVLRTIVFAAFGVNSNKNREHDFRNANPLHLIIGGVIFMICFITTIALIVSIVLSNS